MLQAQTNKNLIMCTDFIIGVSEDGEIFRVRQNIIHLGHKGTDWVIVEVLCVDDNNPYNPSPRNIPVSPLLMDTSLSTQHPLFYCHSSPTRQGYRFTDFSTSKHFQTMQTDF